MNVPRFITNFPPNYPLYKKISANGIYFITGMPIINRTNHLSKQDLIKSRLRLRRGDIILVGDLHQFCATLIGDPFTHVLMYVGRKRFIEAHQTGVRYINLHYIFTTYDTLAIVRLPQAIHHRQCLIKKAIKYAQKQLGKAYDFDFGKTKQGFFCTKLVNEAYLAAGYKTGLSSTHNPHSLKAKVLSELSRAINALHPLRFMYGNFKVVMLSHNLVQKGNKITLEK